MPIPRFSRFYILVLFFFNGLLNITNQVNAQVVSITGAGSNTNCNGWGVVNNAQLTPCAAIMPSNFYNLAIAENASSSINFNMNTSMGSGYILLDFDLWMGKLSNNAGSGSDYVSIFFNGTSAANEFFRISQISNSNYTIIAYNGGTIISAPIPAGTSSMAKAGRVLLRIPFSGRPTTAGSTTALTFFHSAGSNDYGLSFYKLGTNDDFIGFNTQPSNKVVCINSNTSFNVVPTSSINGNPTPTYAYQWYKNGTIINNGGVFSGATTSTLNLTGVTNSEAASYTCVVSTNTGSGTISYTSNPATLIANASPTITGTLSACVGSTSQLTGSATANTLNPWVSSNSSIASVSNAGLVTAISAGTVTITYKNSNGCEATQTFISRAKPVLSASTGNTYLCGVSTTPASTYTITANAAPFATSPWTSSATNIATIAATSSTSNSSLATITQVAGGTTNITFKDINGCTTTTPYTVQNVGISAITANTTICTGQSVNLNATSAGNIINWYDAAGTQLSSVLSAVNYVVTPSTPGTYTYYAEAAIQASTNYLPSLNYYTWVVPNGVTALSVQMKSGGGGTGGCDTYCGAAGNQSKYINSSITVTPGQTLQIAPGFRGGNGGSNATNCCGGIGGKNAFGYNGGDGGAGGPGGWSGAGGAGGGASVLKIFNSNGTLDREYILAGSGGGGGGGQFGVGANPVAETYRADGAPAGAVGLKTPGDGGGGGGGGGGKRGGIGGPGSPTGGDVGGSGGSDGLDQLYGLTFTKVGAGDGFITISYEA